MTREHGISFRPDMAAAIRAGRKIQTRRILKPQPSNVDKSGRWYRLTSGGESLNCYDLPIAIGDTLWVREPLINSAGYVAYAPEHDEASLEFPAAGWPSRWKWKGEYLPADEMPKWACRARLRVTDLRIERVQDISDADAVAEGWPGTSGPDTPKPPVIWFRDLWNEIHGPDAWERNDWVVAYSFEEIE